MFPMCGCQLPPIKKQKAPDQLIQSPLSPMTFNAAVGLSGDLALNTSLVFFFLSEVLMHEHATALRGGGGGRDSSACTNGVTSRLSASGNHFANFPGSFERCHRLSSSHLQMMHRCVAAAAEAAFRFFGKMEATREKCFQGKEHQMIGMIGGAAKWM